MNRIISFNRIYFLRFLFIFALVAMFLVPMGAYAATTAPVAGVAIDFGPILNQVVVPVVAALLMALASWALAKIATLAHLNGQSQLRDLLEQIIDNGIAWAVQKAQSLPSASTSVQVNNALVAQAVTYVETAAPGILKTLGIDLSSAAGQAKLENWILARLGVANGATTPGVATTVLPTAAPTPAA